MPLTRTSGPGAGKTPDAGSVTPGPALPESCLPGYQHVYMREADGVSVCQVCGQVGGRR